jgi:aminoglycoside phosphotransferase (APT) family kinase protein
VYRYEPDLVKEAFVLWLVAHADDTPCDAVAAAAFSRLCVDRYGTVTDRHSALPVVHCYDWSRHRLPHPYCIYEWVDGVPLWDVPEPRVYASAGEALVRIHQVRFSAFYADFLAVGAQPVNWHERYRAAFDKEVSAARNRLPASLNTALRKVEIPPSVSYSPCLIHNDFAPGNILVRDGTIAAIIDWDNAVVDAPQLDFVKMKYWTAKKVNGELGHEPELFSAFVEGYGPSGQEIVSSSAFRLYEILWLLRVFNFERSKEEQGLARAPGYPAAAMYERFLAEVLS